MSNENYEFIQAAIIANASLVTKEGADGFWVNYGSWVLNTQKQSSDIDLLYVHNRSSAPTRVQGSFRGFPVTIYSVCKSSLLKDGQEGIYGGYFAGKVLNPFVAFGASSHDYSDLRKASGGFIADFASSVDYRTPGELLDKTQLAVDSIFGRLLICPWYINYFVRYYILPKFNELWQHMVEVITESMIESGKVVCEDSEYRYTVSLDRFELYERVALMQARFWSLGSCLHGADPNFPDFYIYQSERYLNENKLQDKPSELKQFLRTAACQGRFE